MEKFGMVLVKKNMIILFLKVNLNMVKNGKEKNIIIIGVMAHCISKGNLKKEKNGKEFFIIWMAILNIMEKF